MDLSDETRNVYSQASKIEGVWKGYRRAKGSDDNAKQNDFK